MSKYLQEIRFAFRRLRKSPTYSITALLTLFIGIAAAVLVFGLLNALLFTSLHVPEPDRLYSVQHQNDLNSSYPDYKDLRDRNKVFSDLALFRLVRVGLGTVNGSNPVWGYEISGNYFETLKLRPFLGRFLQPSDEHTRNAEPYVVLSYNCWRQRFGGDPSILGLSVHVNNFPYTVIGIAPEDFRGTERIVQPEVWLPALNETNFESFDWIEQRPSSTSWLIGRLKAGIYPKQAEADLNDIASQLAREYPDVNERRDYHLSQPGLLGDTLGAPVQGLISGIMLLAILQLIAVCANLGVLFAARTSDRRRELALRVALGSSRKRIFRELLVETLLLSFIACTFAVILTQIAMRALSQWRPLPEFPVSLTANPGITVYFFAFCLSVATGVLFGALSARDVWRTDPNLAIRSVGDNLAPGRFFGLRDLLLGVQIAVCCLLVTACFVSIAGLQKAIKVPMGFNTERVYLASFDLRLAGYKEADASSVQEHLLQAVAVLPGVTQAAYGNTVPLALDQSSTSIVPESAGEFGSASNTAFPNPSTAIYYQISPGYLPVSTIRLIAGRDFTRQDNARSPKVAIVSQSLASKLYGTESPIGRRFYSRAQGTDPWEIVGVVEDGRYQTWGNNANAVFYPILQVPSTTTVLLTSSGLPAAQVLPEVRQAIFRVDSGIPIFNLSSWTESLDVVLFPARAVAIVIIVFGAIAIVLAVTGMFGLASSTVSRRLRDLGIRMALGARPFQIARVVLMRTSILLVTGSIIGFLLGYAVSKIIASIVYQATPNVAWILAEVVATMFLTGALATSLPLRRALSSRPIDLLRSE